MEPNFAGFRARQQKLQRQRGLAGAGRALYQIEAPARQAALENIVEPVDAGGSEGRRVTRTHACAFQQDAAAAVFARGSSAGGGCCGPRETHCTLWAAPTPPIPSRHCSVSRKSALGQEQGPEYGFLDETNITPELCARPPANLAGAPVAASAGQRR